MTKQTLTMITTTNTRQDNPTHSNQKNTKPNTNFMNSWNNGNFRPYQQNSRPPMNYSNMNLSYANPLPSNTSRNFQNNYGNHIQNQNSHGFNFKNFNILRPNQPSNNFQTGQTLAVHEKNLQKLDLQNQRFT